MSSFLFLDSDSSVSSGLKEDDLDLAMCLHILNIIIKSQHIKDKKRLDKRRDKASNSWNKSKGKETCSMLI